MSSQESSSSSGQVILKEHIEIANKAGMTDEERNKEYDDFSDEYNNHVYSSGYNAPNIAVETMAKFIPESKRAHVVGLDIGAGTGIVGEKMSESGFTTIDAIEPAEGMLSTAKEKNVYRNYICETFSDKPQAIEAGTYDFITAVGVHGPNHVPPSAFHEILRLSKQGAIICVVTRAVNYTCNDGYKDVLFPVCQKLEEEGKWKNVMVKTFPNYINDVEGIVIAYEVL